MARRFGVSDEELRALDVGDLSRFSPPERTALEYAGRLTIDANHIGDDLFDELRKQFDEGEIIEISTVAGLFNYFNRVNNALQMEPTR